MCLTQYLEFQEDQDMTRLLKFLELKKGEEMRFFMFFGMKERGVLYSNGGENMNKMPFNEG